MPLEDGSPYAAGLHLGFDALAVFGTNATAAGATSYVYDHFGANTSALGMMNPGYDNGATGAAPWDPPFTGVPDLGLVDYIVAARLFNFYMVNACIPGGDEAGVLERMMGAGTPWAAPVPVFGYNDAWNVLGGDFFEAGSLCTANHTLGTVASQGTNNIPCVRAARLRSLVCSLARACTSFFSRTPSITTPLRQNPSPRIVYDPAVTYLTLVVGDGDNLAYVKGGRMAWMVDRVSRCASHPATCFPLVWSLSGWPLTLAPDWVRWYYNQSYATGQDFFSFPPSVRALDCV